MPSMQWASQGGLGARGCVPISARRLQAPRGYLSPLTALAFSLVGELDVDRTRGFLRVTGSKFAGTGIYSFTQQNINRAPTMFQGLLCAGDRGTARTEGPVPGKLTDNQLFWKSPYCAGWEDRLGK